MKSTTLSAVLLLSLVAGYAQDVPLQRPEERKVTRQQSERIYDAIRPVASQGSPSTVWVWSNRRQVAMGTVVGDGSQVLTKWSEVAFSTSPIQVVGGDGSTATASVLGVYREEDIVLLQLEGQKFTPVNWSSKAAPGLGKFLVASGPDDNPLSFGVVAVEERGLRESDQAFIGIASDMTYRGEGIKVTEVFDESGAKEAGIRRGDILSSIEGSAVNSAFELRNALLNYSPGDEVTAKISRDGKEMDVTVPLGRRQQFQGIPEGRLRMMREMGGPISLVGNGFPTAIQTDMQLKPRQCGGPVLDLDGDVVGISIARADRTRSFIIPSAHVLTMLGKDPVDPALAVPDTGTARPRQMASAPRIPKAVPMNPETAIRLRERLEEMSELLDRMEREMESIGEDEQ